MSKPSPIIPTKKAGPPAAPHLASMRKVYLAEKNTLTRSLNKVIRDCQKEIKIHQKHLNAVRRDTDRRIAKCQRSMDSYTARIVKRIQILEGRLS